MAYYEIVSGK